MLISWQPVFGYHRDLDTVNPIFAVSADLCAQDQMFTNHCRTGQFGGALALCTSGQEDTMLRITAQDTPNQVTLKLEGSLVGTWVLELEDAWRATNSDRLICLDLTAVDQVDSAGKYLLVLLRDRGVRLIASGLVMTQTVAELVEQWHLRKDQ